MHIKGWLISKGERMRGKETEMIETNRNVITRMDTMNFAPRANKKPSITKSCQKERRRKIKLPVQFRWEKFGDQLFVVWAQVFDINRFVTFGVEIIWVECPHGFQCFGILSGGQVHVSPFTVPSVIISVRKRGWNATGEATHG